MLECSQKDYTHAPGHDDNGDKQPVSQCAADAALSRLDGQSTQTPPAPADQRWIMKQPSAQTASPLTHDGSLLSPDPVTPTHSARPADRPRNLQNGTQASTPSLERDLETPLQRGHGCNQVQSPLFLQETLEMRDGPICTSSPLQDTCDHDPASSTVHWYPQNRSEVWPIPTALRDAYPEYALLYNAVKSHGVPNAIGARICIPTPLDPQAWSAVATGHPQDSAVLDGIRYGFGLQYDGPPIPSSDDVNHQSAVNYPSQVNKYIETESGHGALLGPFKENPFTWSHLSPLMSRPKTSADPNQRRIIVDLSYPPHSNVNMGIPPNTIYGEKYPHSLPTIDDVARVLYEDDYAGYMFTVDISRAYRNFPIDPLDWPLTGIKVGSDVWIDRVMPFGARSSSLHMQLAAQYIVRHLHEKGITTLVYLDDLIGYAHDKHTAQAHYETVIEVMGVLGLPLATEKLTPPTRVIKWLGITVNANDRTLSLPVTKVKEFLHEMTTLHAKHKLCRKDVQSLAGKINHISKVCRPARLFMARILAYLRGHPPGYTPVPQGVRADIRWFLEFLPGYNGTSLIPPPTPTMGIEADSCLQGGGALGDGVGYMYQYPEAFAQAHISQLEAINCMAAIRAIIGHAHRGHTVLVECDNSAAISIFQSGRGREPVILACARAIWRHAAEMNCALIFKHTPGELMDATDALSRACLSPRHEANARQVIASKGLRVIEVDFSHFDYSAFL